MELPDAITSYEKAILYERQKSGEAGQGGPKEYLSLYYNNCGLAHYHKHDYQEALTNYNQAILAIEGKNAENYFNRGNVYLNQEAFEDAHKDFDTAI